MINSIYNIIYIFQWFVRFTCAQKNYQQSHFRGPSVVPCVEVKRHDCKRILAAANTGELIQPPYIGTSQFQQALSIAVQHTLQRVLTDAELKEIVDGLADWSERIG